MFYCIYTKKHDFRPLKNYSVNPIDPNQKITLAGSNLKYFPSTQCRILRKNDFKKKIFFWKKSIFSKKHRLTLEITFRCTAKIRKSKQLSNESINQNFPWLIVRVISKGGIDVFKKNFNGPLSWSSL